MSTGPEADPFTLVMHGIWEMLESKDFFTALVKEQNRIKIYEYLQPGNKPRRPEKDSLMESDVPEVMVYPGPIIFWPPEERDSSGASMHRVYSILMTSGERLVDKGLIFPLEWAIARAMFDYEALMQIKYENQTFVQKVEIPSAETGLTEALNRDLKGWASVWQVDVMFWFSNTIWRGG